MSEDKGQARIFAMLHITTAFHSMTDCSNDNHPLEDGIPVTRDVKLSLF